MWRFAFDPETGDLWAGDVGQNRFEEINLILPGGNYGWNRMEGAHCFRPSVNECDQTGVEPPVIEYPLSGERCAVIGGNVYRGSRLPPLYGAYIYADYCSGEIWALHHDGGRVTDQLLLNPSRLQIPAFGEDEEGEVYILSFDGRIHRFKAPW